MYIYTSDGVIAWGYVKLFAIKRGESMSAIYVQNSIDSIGVLMRKSIYGFRKRVNSSDNMLLQCVNSSLYFYHASSININWNRLLY